MSDLQCMCGQSHPKGCLYLSPTASALKTFVAPACGQGESSPLWSPHNKLLFSLASFCLNFAGPSSCISFNSSPAWKKYSGMPKVLHL